MRSASSGRPSSRSNPRFTLKDGVEDKRRHDHLFELAEANQKRLGEGHTGVDSATRQRIHSTLELFVEDGH